MKYLIKTKYETCLFKIIQILFLRQLLSRNIHQEASKL